MEVEPIGYSPAKERRAKDRSRNRHEVPLWVTATLKRDILRIAEAEGRTRNITAAGLLRLGIAAYFELCGRSEAADRLRAKMTDRYTDVWDKPPTDWAEVGRRGGEAPHNRYRRSKHVCTTDVCREWCELERQGKEHFESLG